jgi:hypothetical protein
MYQASYDNRTFDILDFKIFDFELGSAEDQTEYIKRKNPNDFNNCRETLQLAILYAAQTKAI